MSADHRPSQSGVWLLEDDTHPATGFDVAGGSAAGITRTGPEEGRKNEDIGAIVATAPSGALLAVADGFGGAPAGERAAGLAISAFIEAALASRDEVDNLRARVLDGFEAANRGILEMGIGAATTLAAVSIESGHARPFHSGDSAILVIGGRGKIKWQTVAHSPAGYAVASGWMPELEAREHAEAQVVSNYLGSPEMRIEVGPKLELAPRDVVLIASDGLTDNLAVEEVAEILVGTQSLTHAVDELANRARRAMATEAGKPDDCTIIAYRRRPLPRSARAEATTMR